jgi:AcrR family transcriptional regulator
MRSAEDTTVQTKGAQTRRAILEAAIARYGRDGYRATSVADIARDASVGGTVAYAYFPSKEALFLAAVDEDAAAVIEEGVTSAVAEVSVADWRQMLLVTLLGALERHPLARRLLAGLEPEVTDRVLGIPALDELRRACAERLRQEQTHGSVRPDIDPVTIANGIVAIMLSLLMSVVQLGGATAASYGDDVAAVLQAAIEAPPSRADPGSRPRRR